MKIIETSWNWNSGLSGRSKTDYIALHHAEASSCSAVVVDKWHKSNGWSGIGYHFFVRKNGSIYRGRPLDKMGAHVSGMNNCSIGICAEGNYMNETMPFVQKKAICELLVYLKGKYPDARIVGHREIGDSNCPGTNYPLEDIKRNYAKYAGSEDDNMEELEKRIKVLEDKLNKPEMIYNYVDKNMPEWARESVQWLMDKGILAGTGDGLGLNDAKLWTCVVLHRAIKFVAKLMGVKI